MSAAPAPASYPDGDRQPAAVHRRVEHVMGMPVSLAIRGRHADDKRGQAAWGTVVGILRDAEAVFSTYRNDSVISRLGRGEIRLGDSPPEVAEVLALGVAAKLQSDGAFDIWRPGPDGEPALDPSGVVKGWATERAAAALKALPETDFCLSAGGDMVCHVARPDAPPWRIGIEDPRDPSALVAVVPVRTGAVATSGPTHRGGHIVDARTGDPPEGIACVTVVGDNLTWADIDATAAFAHGRAALAWLATRPGRTGLVVWDDGSADVFATPRV